MRGIYIVTNTQSIVSTTILTISAENTLVFDDIVKKPKHLNEQLKIIKKATIITQT